MTYGGFLSNSFCIMTLHDRFFVLCILNFKTLIYSKEAGIFTNKVFCNENDHK
jgi:hypothetical protein